MSDGECKVKAIRRRSDEDPEKYERRRKRPSRENRRVKILSDEKEQFIYVFGGEFSQPTQGSVECYNVKEKTWTLKDQKMPNSGCGVGVAQYQEHIWVLGGCTGRTNSLNTAYVYDPESDNWLSKPPMSEKRSGLGVIEFDGWLYAVGGQDLSAVDYEERVLDSTEAYNCDSGWIKSSDMLERRTEFGIAAKRSFMIVVGGYNGSTTTLDSVEIYPRETKQWTKASGLETLRRGFGLTFVGRSLYAVGGDKERTIAKSDVGCTEWIVTMKISNENRNRSRVSVAIVGLEKIHQMTKHGRHELRIDMIDESGVKLYAKYRVFKLAPQSENYRLTATGYSGYATDALFDPPYIDYDHNNMPFSTKDADHDNLLTFSCASLWKGAWWYNRCVYSNLNGEYGIDYDGSGVKWRNVDSEFYMNLRFTEMKFR